MSFDFDAYKDLVGDQIANAPTIDWTRPVSESLPWIEGPTPSYRPIDASGREFSEAVTGGYTPYTPSVYRGEDVQMAQYDMGGGAGTARQGAVFPERVGIDLAPIWNAINGQGMSTTLGLLKFIPGNPVGNAMARIGETLQNMPVVGGAVDIMRHVVTSPFESAKYFLTTPVQGKNVWDEMLKGNNPWDALVENWELSRGHIGAMADVATALVPAGAAWRAAGKATAGGFLSGVVNPFRGGTMGQSTLAWFVAPVTSEAFRIAAKREAAEMVGRTFSRFALPAYGVGTASGAIIRATNDPDSWIVREVADNHIVPEGSPWEGPLELAMALPLDIFGAAKVVNSLVSGSARFARTADRILGEANPADVHLPGWQEAVKSGVVSLEAVKWFARRGLRDAAQFSLLDDFNREVDHLNAALLAKNSNAELLPHANHPYQMHFAKQGMYDGAILRRMRTILDMPAAERAKLIDEAIAGRGVRDAEDYRAGWELIEDVAPAQRLAQLDNYYHLAKHVDTALSGMMLRVDTQGAARQAEQAIAYLRGGDVNVGGGAKLEDPWKDKDFYDFQDSVLENLPKEMRNQRNLGKTLEDAMDIGRGLATGAAGGYTEEKIAAVRKWITDPGRASALRAPMDAADRAKARELADKYAARGPMNPALEAVRDLTVALTRQNIERARAALTRLDEILEKGVTDPGTAIGTKFGSTAEELAAFNDRFPALKGLFVKGAPIETTVNRIEEWAKRIEDVPEPVKLGRLKNAEDDLRRQMHKAGNKATPEQLDRLQSIRTEIQKINDKVADGYAKAADLAQTELDDRVRFLWTQRLTDATKAGRPLVDATIERLQKVVDENRLKEFNARYIHGSRYTLDRQLPEPLQRVFDENADKLWDMPKGRTQLAQWYDRLFGGIGNAKIVREAREKFTDFLYSKGLSESQIRAIFKDMYTEVQESVTYHRTGARRQKYGTIFNLPERTIYKIVERHAGKEIARAHNWHEGLYRSYPGPLTILQRQVTGKDIPMKYEKNTTQFFRTYLPMIRFYADPRFIAMNFVEPKFHEFFLRGGGKFTNQQWERAIAYQRQAGRVRVDIESGELLGKGDKTLENLANLTVVRDDDLWDAILDTWYKVPENRDFIKSQGIKTEAQFRKKMEEVFKEHIEVIHGTIARSDAERALKKEVDELAAKLEDSLTIRDDLELRMDLEDKQRKLSDLIVERKIADELAGQKIPEGFQPFIEAWEKNYKDIVHAAREALLGNASRSAVERAANSFLLFWPISYQIKVTRAMFEFMTKRAFGAKTNLAGAVATGQVMEWHRENLQTDGVYAKFFSENRQALYLMSMFFPVLPSETGVSLSPVFRLPLQVARGYRTTAEGVSKMSDVGPVMTINLVHRFIQEQSRPGRIFSGIFSFGQNRLEEKLPANYPDWLKSAIQDANMERTGMKGWDPESMEFQSSDDLIRSLKYRLTPQAFDFIKNTKIERPAMESEMADMGAAGLYWFEGREPTRVDDTHAEQGAFRANIFDTKTPSKVQVGREMESVYGDNKSVVDVAYHEILHKLSMEHPDYREDAANGWPRLADAIGQSMLMSGTAPSQELMDLTGLIRTDPAHAWVHAAQIAHKPAPLQKYFAPITGGR